MDPQAHKQFVTSVFDKVATGYDNPSQRFFQYSGDYLVKLLRPKPGSKVLDIAAGTGATTIAFAQAIGPQGRVQAIGEAPHLLEVVGGHQASEGAQAPVLLEAVSQDRELAASLDVGRRQLLEGPAEL